jgi:hypothetical protein
MHPLKRWRLCSVEAPRKTLPPPQLMEQMPQFVHWPHLHVDGGLNLV